MSEARVLAEEPLFAECDMIFAGVIYMKTRRMFAALGLLLVVLLTPVTVAAKEATSAELALMGYAELVPTKPDAWRNTAAGNKVAGVRPPRLTRKTAEDLLADVVDRAVEVNRDDRNSLRITKIVAFGGITKKHERIQDIDLGVQLEPKREDPYRIRGASRPQGAQSARRRMS